MALNSIYFECSAGISGNMVLGSLLDLGISQKEFHDAIDELSLPVKIEIKKVKRCSISAILVTIEVLQKEQKPRNQKEIEEMIEKSPFSPQIKNKARLIFNRLFEAEAKVHGFKKTSGHLHEAGADDALVDVFGTLFLLEKLKVKKISSSPLNLGRGFVETHSGRFPIPAPAVGELLKNVPVYSESSQEVELVTPTGASILVSLCEKFSDFPYLKYEKIGYGAGSKDVKEFPNVLRAFYGEETQEKEEKLFLVETNIDDVEPQILGNLMEKMIKKGALDVYYTPVYMKKNRPGVLVSILCDKKNVQNFLNILFSETTTIGTRINEVTRVSLPRETKYFEFFGEKVKIKVSFWKGKEVTVKPEFEDCLRISEKIGMPLMEVISEIKRLYGIKKNGSKKD
ncbi:MAG: nickel pincer cofactor biosynthesis protein LarC [Acidobacteriota bacterium]